jgi:hypothetical protein
MASRQREGHLALLCNAFGTVSLRSASSRRWQVVAPKTHAAECRQARQKPGFFASNAPQTGQWHRKSSKSVDLNLIDLDLEALGRRLTGQWRIMYEIFLGLRRSNDQRCGLFSGLTEKQVSHEVKIAVY